MANILYANNAAGTLAAGITNVSTALTLNAGQGALFPNPSAPQVFYVTLTDAATQTLIEIVKVTAVSGDVFSIIRAQDGTSALSWNSGDIVSQRTIRLELQGFENAAEGLFNALNVPITPVSTLGIKGTTAGDNANTGSIGEYLSQALSGGGAINNVPVNSASIGLTAGDWDVSGTIGFFPNGGAVITSSVACLSTVSATLQLNTGQYVQYPFTAPANVNQVISTPVFRVNVTTNTTIFLVAQASFSSGTVPLSGLIRARRVR